MKRGSILLALAVAAPLFLVAQTENVAPKPSWKGFVTNGFWDNWYVSAGAGIKVYDGPHDTRSDFSERIAPTFDFSVGKWIVPTLGVRAHLNGVTAKGYTNSADKAYVSSKTPDKNGMFPQKWHQTHAQVNVLVNASNWIGGYRPDRFFEFVPFAGGGWIHSWTDDGSNSLTLTAGLINKMRLTKALDLNVELRGDLFDAQFSGEPTFRWYDGELNATVGLAYNFCRSTFSRTNDDKLREEIAALLDAADKLKDARNKLSQENSALQDKLRQEQAKSAKLQSQLDNQPAGAAVQGQLIFFKIGDATVCKADKDRLTEWAKVIKETPAKRFVITGYADKDTGSPQRNLVLSKERAENVFKILTKELGVSADRFKVEYKGGVSPKELPAVHSQRVTIVAE